MSQTAPLARLRGMKRALALILALVMGGNGLVMLVAGRWWYGAVPGVTETGPFNPHFVKDIGAEYLVVGVALGWLAARPGERRGGVPAAARRRPRRRRLRRPPRHGRPRPRLSRRVPARFHRRLAGG